MKQLPGRRGLHHQLLRAVYERAPALTRAVGTVTDSVFRIVVGPQVPVPEPARTYTPEALENLTDHLNERAEHYFASQLSPEFRTFLLRKPFSDIDKFGQHLFAVGTLVHWLRLRPADVVLEIGAGSGWLSNLLHQYGCRTISVDVSATAVRLARQRFEDDCATDWAMEPEFRVYDGRRLPVEDGSVDRVVVYDAFHHIPNQREVLAEMARVLRDGGVVGMSEPGRRHSLSNQSRDEVEATGVLENDIVVEDLDVVARQNGFHHTTVVPLSLQASVEVDSAGLVRFLRGRGFQRFWTRHAQAVLSEHVILLYKGTPRPDTRRPSVTTARIDAPLRITATVGEPAVLRCTVTNTGDTLWRTSPRPDYGTTRLGVRLADVSGAPVALDWHRAPLAEDLAPGRSAELTTSLPPLTEPGAVTLQLDMVAEHVRWFSDAGSPLSVVHVDVVPAARLTPASSMADGRSAHRAAGNSRPAAASVTTGRGLR